MARPRQPIRPKDHQTNKHRSSERASTCQERPKPCESSSSCRPRVHCRASEADATDLCKRFLEATAQTHGHQWREVWELLVTHAWFQKRLAQCARTTVRSSQLPRQLADDVGQEVILQFAKKLQRIPDLRVDRECAKDHFAGWMYTILVRECRMAVRSLRRLHFRTLPLLTDRADADHAELHDLRMDLHEALSQLDAEDARVLLLQLDGCEAKEIAEWLDVSLSTAYRFLRRANERLERKLRR